MDCEQDNIEIVRDSLPIALKEHQQKRADVLSYALYRASNKGAQTGGKKPDFWNTPTKSVVIDKNPNPTQWYDIVASAANRLTP